MNTLLQDLRYGVRMLLKAPVVSAVAVLSLALGIAANASIFSILNAFLFEPLPYHDQDGLVIVSEVRPGETIENFNGTSVGNFRDYEAAARTLENGTIYTLESGNLTGVDAPEQLQVVVATPNLFDVLGVQPSLGRGFRAEEGTEGRGDVLVLEHDFWQSRFLGDRDVLGRTLTVDGAVYTVVGVMPEAFDLIPANVQAFRPSDFADRRDEHAGGGYISFARMAPGATVSQVQAELGSLWPAMEAADPEANRGRQVMVTGARDFFPGPTDRKLVMMLTAVTLFGLLIACANVANLLLGRAEERQKEVAVRTALGAARHRILRQLLTESVTLGVVAGGLGVVLAVGVVRWLQGVMPAEIPRAMVPEMDAEVLAATLAVSVLAGIAFGLVPAFYTVRADLREALGEGSRGGSASRARRRLRYAFVVGEFAVALALLTGAGFLTEIFHRLTASDPGYRQEGLLTFVITAPEDRFPDADALRRYSDDLLAALGQVPGVRGVAAMSSLPRGRGNPSYPYTVEGRPVGANEERPSAGFQAVSPDHFATLEIPVLQGRGIERTDREEGQHVVVVSRAFARREFPGEDPLGRTLVIGDGKTPRAIVGVVGDILQERIQMAGQRGEALYVPLAQSPLRAMAFALRVPGDPGAAAADVRRAVWGVNPDQPVAQLRTLDDFVAESLAGPRAISLFLTAMGLIALLLAAMGIYGVMAHAVSQQRREIGIRMALGAGRGRVVGMVTRSGLSLAGAGMLLGLPLSYLMYRAVAGALDLFEAPLGLSFAAWVAAALAGVAFVSTWLPARRASGVHPGAALRE